MIDPLQMTLADKVLVNKLFSDNLAGIRIDSFILPVDVEPADGRRVADGYGMLYLMASRFEPTQTQMDNILADLKKAGMEIYRQGILKGGEKPQMLPYEEFADNFRQNRLLTNDQHALFFVVRKSLSLGL